MLVLTTAHALNSGHNVLNTGDHKTIIVSAFDNCHSFIVIAGHRHLLWRTEKLQFVLDIKIQSASRLVHSDQSAIEIVESRKTYI
jgi:hypothetical protein